MTKNEIIKFTDGRTIVMLGTINSAGVPEIRGLINIRHHKIAPHLTEYFKRDDRLLFITNTSSEKIGQIRANPNASLYCFDDAYNGLLLMGRVAEVTDAETRNTLWDDTWKIYYPDGRDGGDFSVLEFVPESYKSYHEFNVKKGGI